MFLFFPYFVHFGLLQHCWNSLIFCTFVAFVEISLQALTDNMILIQSSWIDNPIRPEEGKAVHFQRGVIAARCRVIFCLWRRLLSLSCTALCFILYSGMWTSLFSHHLQGCYITTGSTLLLFCTASGPHRGCWYLTVDKTIQQFHAEPAWSWKLV